MEKTRITPEQDVTLQEYVNSVYERISEDISALPVGEYQAPHLIVIGEKHMSLSESSQKEPPMGAAYVHVSALKAGVEKFGHDEVVLSVELTQELLDQMVGNIQQGNVNPNLLQAPIYHAVKFALDNDIAMIGSDVHAQELLHKMSIDPNLNSEEHQAINDKREHAMIGSTIVGTGLVPDGEASLVVKVTGVAHLSGFMGISENATPEEIQNRQESELGVVEIT